MENQETTIDIKDLIKKVLQKWHWFVISCAIFGVFGIAYYLYSVSKYQVDAIFQIRSSEESFTLPGADMLQMFGLGGSKQIEDEINIITSRDLLIQTIHELDIQTTYLKRKGPHWINLYGIGSDLQIEYPKQFLDTAHFGVIVDIKVRKHDYAIKVKTGRFQISRFTVKDLSQPLHVKKIGDIRITPLKALQTGDNYRILTPPILDLAKYYGKAVVVNKIKKESSLIRVSFVNTNTILAKDFINKQIEIYNRNSVIDKEMMANATAVFIEERLNLIAKELASAEADVEQYKKDNNLTVITAQAELYLTENAEYRHRIEALETQEKLVTYVETYVTDDSKKDQLIPANLGIEDVSLGDLIGQYNNMALRRMRMQRTATEDNPVIQNLDDQLKLLRQNILTSIRSVKNSIAIQKRDISEQAGKSDALLASVPTKEREFIEKNRNKEIQQKLYLFLYQKREENAFSLVTAVPPAHVISSAQADPARLSPRLSNIGLICLVLGLGFPAVLLYLKEILNNKVQNRKLFSSTSTLQLAGEVLYDQSGDAVIISDGIDTPASEMFRMLRTNLTPLLQNLPTKVKHPVMMVTSCTNGEGKSYIALNLSIAFALLNKRVALVELNFRCPSIAQTLGMSSSKGITYYLNNPAIDYDEIAISSHLNAHLDIFPAGLEPTNPSELLQSERLETLIDDLRKHYDYIIIDTAPITMVSDTFIINRVCDASLIISRANYTTYDMISYVNEITAQQRLVNPVAVLNCVEMSANTHFDFARK